MSRDTANQVARLICGIIQNKIKLNHIKKIYNLKKETKKLNFFLPWNIYIQTTTIRKGVLKNCPKFHKLAKR